MYPPPVFLPQSIPLSLLKVMFRLVSIIFSSFFSSYISSKIDWLGVVFSGDCIVERGRELHRLLTLIFFLSKFHQFYPSWVSFWSFLWYSQYLQKVVWYWHSIFENYRFWYIISNYGVFYLLKRQFFGKDDKFLFFSLEGTISDVSR